MINKLDHIGILVEDIATTQVIYDQLGLTLVKREHVAEFDVEIAFLSTGTELVELVEPLSADSEFTQLLNDRSHSGFIHHLAFRVDDIDAALRDLERTNVGLVDQTPRLGADGARVAFLEQQAGNGVTIELVERDEEIISGNTIHD